MGFPCQPHSLAGKRMASGDERDLWGEFARCIRDLNPRWVLGENVAGLLSSENGRFFGRVLRDLAQMGYRAGWALYPASWVGAIHRRERVFIVAHATGDGCTGLEKKQQIRFANEPLPIRTEWASAENDSLPYVRGILDSPERGVLRNDDGLPEGMDRIRCLGNAVMPDQVLPILDAIAMVERKRA
ncbi:DNA cytosine methyltransferase [Eubacteriales bacterium OttesenSCG-928-A19]|nr:DNA cytosine methyltransferase [Eubacteriales bacterium OttesenSCG-928-A19]